MSDRIKRIAANPPGHHYGPDVRQVVQVVVDLVNVGDVLTYRMVQDLCGIDMQRKRHLVGSIKTMARDRYGIELRVIPGLGYERLSEPEKVNYIDDNIGVVHRKTIKIADMQKAVDMAALSPMETQRYLAYQSINAGLLLWSHPQVRQQLPSHPEAVRLPFNVDSHKDLWTRSSLKE